MLSIVVGILIVGGTTQKPSDPNKPRSSKDVEDDPPSHFHFFVQTNNRPRSEKPSLDELHSGATRLDLEAEKLYKFAGQPPFRLSTSKNDEGNPKTVMTHVHHAHPAEIHHIHLEDQHGKPMTWDTGGGPLSDAVNMVDPKPGPGGSPQSLAEKQHEELERLAHEHLEHESATMTEKMAKAKTPEEVTSLMHQYRDTRERLARHNPANTDDLFWMHWAREQDEPYLRQLVRTTFP